MGGGALIKIQICGELDSLKGHLRNLYFKLDSQIIQESGNALSKFWMDVKNWFMLTLLYML